MEDRAQSSGRKAASSWVMALAATAGLGVGAGASFAVGGAGKPSSSAPPVLGSAHGATPSLSPPPPTEHAATDLSALPGREVPFERATADELGVEAPELQEDGEVAAARAEHAPPVDEAPVVVPPLDTLLPPIDPRHAEEAIEKVFKKKKADRQLAREFYQAYGAGRFARANGPTLLGLAIVERVRALPEHAIDPAPYELDALETLIRTHPTGAGDGGAHLDVRLFQALLDLAMDSRFLHKAGPFDLRDRDKVYQREKKDVLALLARIAATSDATDAMALLDPPHPQYQPMRLALADYRALAEAGGCPKLANGWRFRPGARGKEVEKLQERLACEGYYHGPVDGRFEGETIEAVKLYQEHHDLPPEGHVLEDTLKSLNVPIEQRVQQIALALQRMRESRFDRMGDHFIRVNIPSFLLKVFDNGQMIREHRVIVGTNRLDDDKVNLLQGHINRTKIFGTRLYEVIVNPTWILPKRVEEGELKTSIEKDQAYLEKSNIKKVKLGSGTEVFVQGAGKGNVLGKVKFLLEESNAIYLHDTDKRQLFKKQRRDFSHGCMRVHEAIDFARWLLLRDGYSDHEIDRAFAAERLQRGFAMKNPINLVTEYITVDLAADGKPVFYDDIYKYDEAYFKGELPPRERTRWGSPILRPRWVPVVDSATVDAWRAAGKPAPRDLGPDGKPKKPGKGGDGDSDPGP